MKRLEFRGKGERFASPDSNVPLRYCPLNLLLSLQKPAPLLNEWVQAEGIGAALCLLRRGGYSE
ncbi:hypothetical protein MMB75_16500 [Paenibacillus sp. P2(2022)]|uniref:hypothetical protein n=1 Tax=Paenibacillus TaxID=44249 RepID=UPI002407335F|nr:MULTISPECIES: hypothetical protein [Paenibacillus]MDG0055283.1 hypothetical protein [Paenibacillus sp. P2(2022)]